MSTVNMHQKVAVWDTYAHKDDGSVMHFDIIVPEHTKDQDKIFEYGTQHLKVKGEPGALVNATHCQFCHVEETTAVMEKSISKQGYYILEMEDIPGELPMDPGKNDLVFSHFESYRFRNFSGVSFEEIHRLLLLEEKNKEK